MSHKPAAQFVTFALALALVLPGCSTLKTTAKIAAAPVKISYKGAELTAKGFYYTGKYSAIGSWEATKLAGKGVYYTGKGAYEVGEFSAEVLYAAGKYTALGVLETMELTGRGVRKVANGVYYIGSIPLRVTERALNVADRVLTITVRITDLAGRVVELAKDVTALQLEAELAFLQGVPEVLDVLLDAEDELAAFKAQADEARATFDNAQSAVSRVTRRGR